MLEEVSCNLCGGRETEFLFDLVEDVTGAEQRFSVVRCKACRLAYVSPRPKKEAISRYYPEGTYYSYSFQSTETLKFRIRNYILEELGGYPHSGKDSICVRVIGKMVASLAKSQVLMFVPNVPKGKALDIGCGCGELLLWLKKHDWSEVHGVEISKGAAELGNRHGLNIFSGELVDARYQDSYFDFIVLNHVLEHMHDPVSTLKEIHRILKPNGLLVVGVPNFESFENEVFGQHQSILKEVPRHLYHFSKKSLALMFDKTGFKVHRCVGKTFFIPKVNNASLRILSRNDSSISVVHALYRLYMERPFRYIVSAEKDTFGQLMTFYVTKNQ